MLAKHLDPRPHTQRPDCHIPDFGPAWPGSKLTYLPNGWAVAVMQIGPELAELMLATNADNQRGVVPSSVNKFAADMESGNWRLTHQGIAFNRAGQLHDGQNRLHAVVKAGVAVPMLVFFGAGEQQEMTVFDTGKNRSSVDAAHVLGMTADRSLMATIHVAAKYARHSKGHAFFTHSHLLDLLHRFGDKATEVQHWFSGAKVNGVDRAPVKAAVLAAYVAEFARPELLQRFAAVLCDKVIGDQVSDSSARVLRQFISNNIRRGTSGGAVAVDLYLRTCAAIQHTVDGRECKLIRPCSSSPFILEPAE